MNKYQTITIGLAILIGIILGSFISNRWYRDDLVNAMYEQKQLELQLYHQINKVDSLAHAYEDLKTTSLSYEKMLNSMNQELKKSKEDNLKLRERAHKFTNDEKRTFLIDRYRTDNK